MSLMVEFASFLGGALTEYAQQNNWSGRKIFAVTFLTFFLLVALYVLLFPAAKGIGIGMSLAAAYGAGMGVFAVAMISLARRYTRKKSAAQEKC